MEISIQPVLKPKHLISALLVLITVTSLCSTTTDAFATNPRQQQQHVLFQKCENDKFDTPLRIIRNAKKRPVLSLSTRYYRPALHAKSYPEKDDECEQQHASTFHHHQKTLNHETTPPIINHHKIKHNNHSRRNFLTSTSSNTLFLSTLLISQPSHARGLVQFPCQPNTLQNTYHFMRAGQSLLEEEGVWSTNPLFVTNRENALSTEGVKQVENSCQLMQAKGVNPSAVRYCLAANSIDTANIVGRDMKVGRDRLVPEFNFLDMRAIGKWDMLPLKSTEAAVWAMDSLEAGEFGMGGRPPAHEDGTPNETLKDQVVRLQQLISVLETQYSGDTILLIFPDGTGPALLTSLIAGIPLNRVHELNFQPGEVRFNINMNDALKQLPPEPTPEYMQIIGRGKEEMARLRENPDEILNIRDEAYQEELRVLAQEKEANRMRMEEERRIKEEEMEIKKRKQEEMERRRAEEKQIERERIAAEKEARLTKIRQQSESSSRSTVVVQGQTNDSGSVTKSDDGIPNAVLASVAAVAVGGIAFGPKGEADVSDDTQEGTIEILTEVTDANVTDAQPPLSSSTNGVESDKKINGSDGAAAADTDKFLNDTQTATQSLSDNDPPQSSATSKPEMPEQQPRNTQTNKPDTTETTILQTEEQQQRPPSRVPEGLVVATSPQFQNPTTPVTAEDRDKKAERVMQEYLDQDDGADAWLGSLAEIMQDDDDD